MECKSNCDVHLAESIFELIDTLWNVNLCNAIEKADDTLELIDTLWNVNEIIVPIAYIRHLELIDTLWNVNWHCLINVLVTTLN